MNYSNDSLGRPQPEKQDETARQDNGTQAAQNARQYPSGGSAANAAPTAPQPEQWARLPQGMRDRAQWCVAGADKSPLIAVDGLPRASSTDPTTWRDFETACAYAAQHGLHIGYVLHESDPFTCIDMDVKDSTSQEQIERYQKIVQTFNSYTERSRSGKGLHILAEGNIGRGRRRDGVEVYSQERFIICTGDVYVNQPVQPHYKLLDVLVAEMSRGSQVEVELEEVEGTDQDWYVAQVALEDTGELGRLFAGDWTGRTYPSQSEADLALVKLLARLTESNRECWSAFRMSQLGKREKASRPDYIRRTLTLARTHLANDALELARGKEIADALFWRLGVFTSTVFGTLSAKPLGVFIRELEAIEFLIDDVYRRGWLYTITGSTGSGKTGVAVSLALCVASGSPVGKHGTSQGVVLYIAGENPDDVRGRFRATLKRGQWGTDVLDKVQVIDQSFLLAERIDELEAIVDALGVAVVIVDTDQAVSLSGAESENDNGVRMKHAKNLRRITRRPSRPTVLDLCHPNGSATKDKLVPRGGSSMLNEIDGNTGCWRDDTVTTLFSDPNKYRGSAFELSFRKEDVTLDEVKDTKGRHIAVPVFLPATDETVVMAHVTQRNDRHSLLRTILTYPNMNQTGWLERLEWRTPSGELNKPKISKLLKAFREADPPLVDAANGLTPAGKKEAKGVI